MNASLQEVGPDMAGNTIAAVIPLYNKEPYVTRAIESVLSQTSPVDEILVVDDVSTDGSLERVKAYKDARIKVIRRTDPRQRGLPATRNVAIRCATSRWIALLDADDAWHADFIEEIQKLATMASQRTGMLFTAWQSVWADGTVTRDVYSASAPGPPVRAFDLDSFVAAWLHSGACPIFPSSVALRRDVLLQAGLFDERCRRGEDKEMWLRMLTLSNALASNRVCSSYYRGIPGQMNDSISTNARHCICTTLEQLIAQSHGARRSLLMRLFNYEVYEYARAVHQRQLVSPEVYRGFYVSVDPMRYMTLLALSYLPLRFQQALRNGLLWSSKHFGVPRPRVRVRL